MTTSKTKKKSIANKITPTLTYKEQGFVKDFVATRNATESIVRNYNIKQRTVAGTMGNENLKKLHIKQEIVNLFNKQGLSLDGVFETFTRNLKQDKHLGVSQSAVIDYLELTGVKKKEELNNQTNISFILNT